MTAEHWGLEDDDTEALQTMSAEAIVTMALAGCALAAARDGRRYTFGQQATHVGRLLRRAGWMILKPEDCCRNAIQDLDAEVWTP